MAGSSELIEATMFKAVADGLLFRVPAVWPFGRTRHYLATEAQKSAIVERVTRSGKRNLLLALSVWVIFIAVSVAAIAWLTGHDDPTLADVGILVTVAAVSLLACLHIYNVLTLRPVIAGLPESAERITGQERREALRRLTPGRSYLLFGVLYSIACTVNAFAFVTRMQGGYRVSFNDGQSFASLLLAIAFGVLAARFFYLEFINAARRTNAEVRPSAEVEAGQIAVRLERMELESCRLRRALASLVILACASAFVTVVVWGLMSGTTRSVNADRFVLHNSKGETAALLGVSKEGAPTLSLYGPEKKLRMLMGLTNTGSPQLGLYGPEEGLRALVGIASDELPVISLSGADGKSRAALVLKNEDTRLVLFDSAGGPRLTLSADAAGGHVRVMDAAGREIIRRE
jgi:hypothetical protein